MSSTSDISFGEISIPDCCVDYAYPGGTSFGASWAILLLVVEFSASLSLFYAAAALLLLDIWEGPRELELFTL